MSYPTIALVLRDGAPVAGCMYPTRDAAEFASLAALHKLCPGASAHHATTHEGYAVQLVDGDRNRHNSAEIESSRWKAHHLKFSNFARLIGVRHLAALVPVDRPRILKALAEGDSWLNTIPLARWDGGHWSVRAALGSTGIKSWSLSESVCVLKHVAVHHVAGGDSFPPADFTAEG